jgi:glutamate 5-kinase
MRFCFYDNDKLAALAAVLLKVDILISQLTRMEFILNRQHDKTPETIALVEDLPSLEKEIGDFKSSQGTGGMQSKIEAALLKQPISRLGW